MQAPGLSEAEAKLKQDVAKAFQHYVYLLRAGDLKIEFKRFDDDSRSALRGDHVWTQLVADGRATVAGGLAATYVAALLETFDRQLTPREVVQQFFRNPSFPIVPSTDEIRRVIFELVNGDWELVDADGQRLEVSSAGQITINSINQTLRMREPAQETEQEEKSKADDDGAITSGGSSGGSDTPTKSDDETGHESLPGRDGGDRTYKRYIVELANRSLTTRESRDEAWQLFRELAKVLDPAAPGNLDHQLINVQVNLTTLEGHAGALPEKAQQIGAKERVEDDEF